MPTSTPKKISPVMGVLQRTGDVDSILDVGVGFGKYGFLFREYLDIRRRRYFKEEWQVQIDGVEIWEKYLTPVHEYIYSKIHVGDIRMLVHTLPPYDLVVLADVLEHMSYSEGVQLLQDLYARVAKKAIVVSYPNAIGGDWKRWENPYERHYFVWKREYIERLFPRVVSNGTQVCYILKEHCND